MEELKDRLVFIRKKRGYKTQESLAAATGVLSRATIANIETGRYNTSPVILETLCRTLNVNKEWLLTGDGPIEPEDSRERILNELYIACASLSEPEQQILLDIAQSMKKHLGGE